MKTLDPGQLRHRVELQKKIVAQAAGSGAEQVVWEKVADLWAKVEPISARDFIQGQAVQSQISTRIIIRYRNDVDPTMRILHRGKVYNIRGVLADNQSGLEWLTLPCSTGTNDG